MSEQHVESRREFLRQAGTIAWATPLILTLVSDPARAQSVSCSPAGTGCGAWDTELEICVPTINLAVCCNDCVRGTGPQATFCYCD